MHERGRGTAGAAIAGMEALALRFFPEEAQSSHEPCKTVSRKHKEHGTFAKVCPLNVRIFFQVESQLIEAGTSAAVIQAAA